MMVRSLTCIAAVLTVVLALAAVPAVAGGDGREGGNGGNQSAQTMSAEQAASIVKRAYGGRVVSVKATGGGYSVRVLLDGGRVKTVLVDANGRLSESN